MLNDVFTTITLCNDLTKREAALLYAKVAPVFPLQPFTKRPLLKDFNWSQAASQDEEQIKQWWDDYPEANIALVMGGDIMCSDLDMKKGENGWESFQKLSPGAITAPIQITPSGGYHIIHKFEDGLINFTKKGEFGGIDMRTTNGYIVVAPSSLPEGEYSWHQGGSVEPLSPVALSQYKAWSTEVTVDRDVDMPDSTPIENLKPIEKLPLREKFYNFLVNGDVHEDYQGDRSRNLLGATAALYQCGLSDADVMGYLENSVGAMDCAQSHSTDRRAPLWLWRYNCLKVRQDIEVIPQVSAKDAFADIELTGSATPTAPVESERDRWLRLARDIDPNDETTAVQVYREGMRISPIFGNQIADILHEVSGFRKSDLEKTLKINNKEIAKNMRGEQPPARETGEPLPIGHPATKPPAKKMNTWDDVIGRYAYISSENKWMDRLTRQTLSSEALNIKEGHVIERLMNEEDAPVKSRMSDTLGARPDTFKVDMRSYWPGVENDLIHIGKSDAINTWQPSTLVPVPGDITPWWELLCHLFPDESSRKRILDWMAFVLQKQHIKINYALLIGGAPRIGKDSIFQPVIQGLGIDNVNPGIKAEMLDEKYDDHFIGVKLAVIQEIHRDGFRDAKVIENKLKIYLASPPDELTLRRLGAPNIQQRNLIQILAFSNYEDALHLADNGDRYLCEWSPAKKLPPENYQRVYDWYEKEQGYAKVVNFLMNYDLTGFNPKSAAPDTTWRRAMMNTGKSDLEYQIEDIVDKIRQENEIAKQRIIDDATVTVNDNNRHLYHIIKYITPAQIQAKLKFKNQIPLKTIATILSEQGIRKVGETSDTRYRVPSIFVEDTFAASMTGDKFKTTARVYIYQIDGDFVEEPDNNEIRLGLCPRHLINEYLTSLN